MLPRGEKNERMIEEIISQGERADKAVKRNFPHLPQKDIEELFSNKLVCLNNNPIQKGQRLPKNTLISVFLNREQRNGKIAPSTNKIQVIYEDEYILAVSKEPFKHTVCLSFLDKNTLVNDVTTHLGYTVCEDGILNGGSINRLDYATSGIVLFAKNDAMYKTMKEDYKHAAKYYLAVSSSVAFECEYMDDKLSRKSKDAMKVSNEGEIAKAYYCPLSSGNHSLLLVRLYSGRRHQIRVQLSHRGLPILGDRLYGGKEAPRMYLHCAFLEITHPVSRRRIFLADIPSSPFFEPVL